MAIRTLSVEKARLDWKVILLAIKAGWFNAMILYF
jgi:hypothetical protein